MQGLRAIAILLVLLAHAELGIVPAGFIGVDVFFVLSGYLISGLLLRELYQHDKIALLNFYTRRIKRLLPALLLMLSVSFALGVLLLSGFEARKQLASAPFSLTWTSNLYFAFASVDYFDELSKRDLFLHTWSLGVEEQFYLIWPIILIILYKAGKCLSLSNRNISWLLLIGLGVICFASFLLSLYWTKSKPEAAFYLMPARIWQLSLGAIAYLLSQPGFLSKNNFLFNKRLNHFMLIVGLCLIVGSALALNPILAYPGFWGLFPTIGSAFVIMSSHCIVNNSLLAHPLLVWLGDRSYSLYLWHWPIFVLGFSVGHQGELVSTGVLILLSVVAAVMSFRFIELPFWKGKLSFTPPFNTLLISLLILAAALFVLYHGIRQLPEADSATDISAMWRSDVPQIYFMPCDSWYMSSEVLPCSFGVKGARKTVVLLGDSIGAQWFSMIPEIFPEPYWRTIVFTKSSCAIVDENYIYKRIGKIYQVCTDWRNAVLDQLDILKPDVLFIGSAATYKFSEDQWIDGSSRIFERVSKVAKTTYVFPGTPSLAMDGPGCITRHLSSEGNLDFEACMAKNRIQGIERVTKFIQKAADRFTNVYLLGLNDLVCPNGNCYALSKEGIVVFRDSQHLTDTFVRALVPAARERLKQITATK